MDTMLPWYDFAVLGPCGQVSNRAVPTSGSSAFPPRRRKNAVLSRWVVPLLRMGTWECWHCHVVGSPISNTHASGREGGWWLGDVVGVSYRVGNSPLVLAHKAPDVVALLRCS